MGGRLSSAARCIFRQGVGGDTVARMAEGNHYFPAVAVRREHLRSSTTRTTCSWKGEASYYDVVVDGEVSHDAAWCYPAPGAAAANIEDHVAFWRGVTVEA